MDKKLGRRRFLHRLTITAGAIAAGTPLVSRADDDFATWKGQRQLIRQGRAFFPQSVASFEPRATSVILWARLQDDTRAGDLPGVLLVGSDRWMRRIEAAVEFTARANDDGVVQVKVDRLRPGAFYYYRFVYRQGNQYYGSNIARTKTAPAAASSLPVRFALASCQDAIGRYYNSYLAALPQDLDFVLHVGDYVYETTGDPSFQNTTGRRLNFTDTAGAIALTGANGSTYYAAASVSNYRELYRFYRDDAMLQRMHERFPFIHIWDDHEFSDDCHGDVATYFDGRRDEASTARRRNAERVFFEYVPIDEPAATAGVQDPSDKALYPDARLYRDFRFGRNLHLVLTDSRSFRPDHLIPEDAFPGTIAIDRAALTLLLQGKGIAYDAVKAAFAPYIDIDNPVGPQQSALFPIYKAVLTGVLTGAYVQAGLSPADAAAKAATKAVGKLDATVVNTLLGTYNALPTTTSPVPLIDDATLAALDRGVSFALMGKASLFSSLGARYFVVKETYDLYAAYRTLLLQDAGAEDLYGPAQQQWLQQTLTGSTSKWKVIANSTSFTSMVLDLTGALTSLPPALQSIIGALPPLLRQRFYLNVDQVDGFPNFRTQQLAQYRNAGNVVLVAGDIHASFATDHDRVWEFTGPAVSSFAFRDGLLGSIAADPTLSQVPGLTTLAENADTLLAAANAGIRHAATGVNGIVVIEANHRQLTAKFLQVPSTLAPVSYYDAPSAVLRQVQVKRFDVPAA
jgi:alkaline phosphatase D